MYKELESKITRNYAELNRVLLELDLKANRSEVEQVEDSFVRCQHMTAQLSGDVAAMQDHIPRLEDIMHNVVQRLGEAEDNSKGYAQFTHIVQNVQDVVASKVDSQSVEGWMNKKADVTDVNKNLKYRPTFDEMERFVGKAVELCVSRMRETSADGAGNMMRLLELKADREEVGQMVQKIQENMQKNIRALSPPTHPHSPPKIDIGQTQRVLRAELEGQARQIRTELDDQLRQLRVELNDVRCV